MSERGPGNVRVDDIADGIANMQLEKMRVDRAKAKAAAKSRQSAKRTNGDGADSEN